MLQEIKYAFKRPQLYLGLLGLFICLFSSSLPIWLTRVAQGDREYLSAMNLSFIPVFLEGAFFWFPFARRQCMHLHRRMRSVLGSFCRTPFAEA